MFRINNCYHEEITSVHAAHSIVPCINGMPNCQHGVIGTMRKNLQLIRHSHVYVSRCAVQRICKIYVLKKSECN